MPHRETSQIVELMTRELGRVAVIAKGARRPRSALRAVLLQFQPLECTLIGQGDLKTLGQAEWVGGCAMPSGQALLWGFYLNELLMRMLMRDDPHPRLFDAYVQAINELGDAGAREETLRRFEWLLLQESGYAPDLTRDRDGLPLDRRARYRLVEGQWLHVASAGIRVRGEGRAPGGGSGDGAEGDCAGEVDGLDRIGTGERGRGYAVQRAAEPDAVVDPEPWGRDDNPVPQDGTFDGATLRELASGRYDAPGVLQQAKRLTRTVLSAHLQGAPLRTRQILVDLQRIQNHA